MPSVLSVILWRVLHDALEPFLWTSRVISTQSQEALRGSGEGLLKDREGEEGILASRKGFHTEAGPVSTLRHVLILRFHQDLSLESDLVGRGREERSRRGRQGEGPQ